MGTFNWREFSRVAIGICLVGIGIAIGVVSEGRLIQLIAGFLLVGIGLALLITQ